MYPRTIKDLEEFMLLDAVVTKPSAASDCYPPVTVINLNPREDFCCICGVSVIGGNKGIAMYEGSPVPHDWTG